MLAFTVTFESLRNLDTMAIIFLPPPFFGQPSKAMVALKRGEEQTVGLYVKECKESLARLKMPRFALGETSMY